MAATPGKEIGVSGLAYSRGGTIDEEINPNLIGQQAIKVFADMSANDPLVGAILYAVDMLLRKVEWHVDKGNGTPKDKQFLEECMEDMSHSWADMVSEILSMCPFGWSFHEIVYKKRGGQQKETSGTPSSKFKDGKVGWRKIPLRAQETLSKWVFTDEGGLESFNQRAAPDYTERVVPIVKGLLFRTRNYKNNPEGRSLIRNAYRPWYFKKRIEEIEGVGIERDLAGFPVIDVPAHYLSDSASAEEKAIVAAFAEIGKNLRRDKQEFLIMPNAYDDNNNKMFDLRLMSASGARSFDTGAIIQRYDQRIAMTILADFILLGHEKVGSFALSSDKTDIFAVSLGALLDVIEDVFNRFAVPRLWELNGFNVEKMPEIKHGDIEDQSLVDLSTFLQALSAIGMTMFPDEDLEDYLRELGHLPELSEDTKKLREQQGQQSQDNQGAGGGPPPDQSNSGQGGQGDNPFQSLLDSGQNAGPSSQSGSGQ